MFILNVINYNLNLKQWDTITYLWSYMIYLIIIDLKVIAILLKRSVCVCVCARARTYTLLLGKIAVTIKSIIIKWII